MNKVFSIPVVVLMLGASAFASDVKIFGKVADTTTGAAIDNVIVSLAKQHAIADTTGADGVFLLSGQTSNILNGAVSGTGSFIRCLGSNVHFSVNHQKRVSIEAFSTSGRLLAKPFDRVVMPGAYRVPVSLGMASQLIYVRITCGSDVRVLRMRGARSRGNAGIKDGDAGSDVTQLFKVAATATVDTLIFIRSGFVAKKLALASYTPADSIRVALKPMHTPRVMRKIAGGTFAMGITGTADTVHSVTVSSFYMDTTEVTQADYWSVMGRNPAIHSNNLKKPVENVTWFDAVLYCNALSKREGFDTAYTFTSRRDTTTGACLELGGIAVDIKKKAYRLPTNAEWEFADRGGSTTTFFWGNDSVTDTVSKYAIFLGNVTADSTTQPVGSKKPNAYGLYDMSGNVWEWCTDQWVAYGSHEQTDPCTLAAPAGSVNLRGGDYLDAPKIFVCGLHTGEKSKATNALPFFGFRVVIPPVYADTELSYMTMVGVTIAAAKDSAVNAWYDTTHIPLLMKYAGLKQAYRYKKFSPADSLTPGGAGYWATYFYPTKTDIDGMNTSQEFTDAITEMVGHWTAGECSTKVAVNYQKIKSWIKKDYTGALNYVTVVRAEFTAGKEAEINNWYNNTHIPLIMKYPGVKKAVRYQKMGASSDINAAAMTTYMAFYYYPTKAAQDSMSLSQAWVGPGGVQENMDNETIDNQMTTAKSLKLQFLKAVIKP